MQKLKEDLKGRAVEMVWNALKAVIAWLRSVNLPELLQHRVVEEYVSLFNSNGTFRKVQKSKLLPKFSLQPVTLKNIYIALIDMGII